MENLPPTASVSPTTGTIEPRWIEDPEPQTPSRRLTKAEREKVAQILANDGSIGRVAEALGLQIDDRRLSKVIHSGPVQTRALEIVRTKFERANITADRVMTEIARVAFSTAKDMFDPVTGRMLGIHEMDDDTAATVTGFEVETKSESRGDSKEQGSVPGAYTVTKVKRADKMAALQVLAKHFKLVNDEDGINALAGALADRLNAAKKRTLAQQADGSYVADDLQVIHEAAQPQGTIEPVGPPSGGSTPFSPPDGGSASFKNSEGDSDEVLW